MGHQHAPTRRPAQAAVSFRSRRSTSRICRWRTRARRNRSSAEAPQVEVGLRTRGEQVEADIYECVLTVTVTAKTARQDAVPRRGLAGRHLRDPRRSARADIQPMLGIHCPTVLFPYARETIADAIGRAGFPPVHLDPINFELLYQQQLAQHAAAGGRAVAN